MNSRSWNYWFVLKLVGLLMVASMGCSLVGDHEVAGVSAKPGAEFSLEVPALGKKPRNLWLMVNRVDGDPGWTLDGQIAMNYANKESVVEIRDFNSRAVDRGSCQKITQTGSAQCSSSSSSLNGIKTVKQKIKIGTLPQGAAGETILIKGTLVANSGRWSANQGLRLVVAE